MLGCVLFLNGLFKSNHPLTSKVEYFSTEHVDDKLKKTTKDMVIGIETDRYIMEVQRKDDKTMATRIFVYSYNAALDTKHTDDKGVIIIDFPNAAVIYLEVTKKTDKLVQELREAEQKAEQKYSQKEKAIAENMRSIDLNDDQISRVLNVQ
ncbi:hypothetical protein FACS1894190_16890 [Spirochaetia bacterium]|nr:hypothetical protein FACS1894190_16890 [Spirochaetia bacterium]